MDESIIKVKSPAPPVGLKAGRKVIEMKHIYEVTMGAHEDDIFTAVSDYVTVELINNDETTETYHVDSELDLEQLFDTSDSVVSYREI